MNPAQRRKSQELRKIVSENIEAYVDKGGLVINGVFAPELNTGDFVVVTLGEVVGNFFVFNKELVSNKVKLEEIGFWQSLIGNSKDKVSLCDFSKISFKLLTDKDKIVSLKKASSLT